MFTKSLTVALTLALYCAASAVVVKDNLIRIPVAKKISLSGGSKLIELDQARARSFKSKTRVSTGSANARAAAVNVPVTNDVTGYLANVSR